MSKIAAAVTGAKMKLETVEPAKRESLHKTLDMAFDEWAKFQELKSLAQAENRLDADDAMYIYNQLGGAPSVFNSRPLEVKVVLTQVYALLLKQSMGR